MIPTMSGLARPELIATPEWVAENLGRQGVRLLDARWRPDGTGLQVYRAGQIPGARYIDWRVDLVDDAEDSDAIRLAAPDRIAEVASRVGIGDGTTVVIYDDTQGLYAARVWWSLQAYGLQQVRILNGGFPAWEAENRPISRGLSDGIELPVVPFAPRGPNRMHLTTSDVRAMLGAPSVALLDARAPAEYRGFEGNTRRLGHIPGAVNVPVGNMHESGSQRLRSGDELRSLLHAANVSRGRRMVAYDGSGVAAAKLALVLMLLGHDDVAVYDGGWAEWGNRLDLPVDR
jgi:thiosulfate/3-mercaptopyruvate sulfurtransferase